jgi:hypothetical protein
VLHHGAVRRLVTARETDIGALINAGSGSGVELFKVADLHQMRVYVRVLQAYASQLRHGTAPRHELRAHWANRREVVSAKVSNRLEVRRQAPRQPHQLDVALTLRGRCAGL